MPESIVYTAVSTSTGESVDCPRFRAHATKAAADAVVLVNTPDGQPLLVMRPHGSGRVITTSIPYFLDGTRRAHPVLARLMIHLTQGLLPIKVTGDVQYLINHTQTGWVVTLINNRGNYKPQQGLAAPRREESVAVKLTTRVPVKRVNLWEGSDAEFVKGSRDGRDSFELTIPAGGIRIIEFQ